PETAEATQRCEAVTTVPGRGDRGSPVRRQSDVLRLQTEGLPGRDERDGRSERLLREPAELLRSLTGGESADVDAVDLQATRERAGRARIHDRDEDDEQAEEERSHDRQPPDP